MPSFPDCRECEFRDRPEVCLAVRKNHPRFCELAWKLGRIDYRDLIRRETLADPDGKPEPAPTATLPEYTSEEAAKILLCDFRYSDCNCLSKDAQCKQSGYIAVTTFQICLACKRSESR